MSHGEEHTRTHFEGGPSMLRVPVIGVACALIAVFLFSSIVLTSLGFSKVGTISGIITGAAGILGVVLKDIVRRRRVSSEQDLSIARDAEARAEFQRNYLRAQERGDFKIFGGSE